MKDKEKCKLNKETCVGYQNGYCVSIENCLGKEKQIEEKQMIEDMTEIIDNIDDNAHITQTRWDGYLAIANSEKIATELLKYYQSKLPENAVMLSREELDKIKTNNFSFGVEKGYKLGLLEAGQKTAEKICEMLDKWGGHGTLYAVEIRKEFGIDKE